MKILPVWLRQEVDKAGKEDIQEIRLRIHAPPELATGRISRWIDRIVRQEDLQFCVNAASQYSPWSVSGFHQGYLTVPGGHRIGLCGEAATKDGTHPILREVRSINIRIARDYPGISGDKALEWGSVLVIGAPGWGKTTLLRDIARRIAGTETVAVVDERGELFPEGFSRGKRMDVLTGCPKTTGIHMVLRTMGPAYIAVDEITEPSDTQALLQAASCGVNLLATAHGASAQDLCSREVYRPLLDKKVFQTILCLHRDKSWYAERLAG